MQQVHNHRLARAVVINSGNANACVGETGDQNAREMAVTAAAAIDCAPEEVLLGSTGVIGVPLNMEVINAGIKKAAAALEDNIEAGHRANLATLTTDTFAKETVTTLTLHNETVTLAGMAKGSGMIHLNLATMIGIITTDVRITADCLQQLLSNAVYGTFNRVTVDGDTSCCDMILVLASGLSKHPMITNPQSPEAQLFLEKLIDVCTDLSRMIAKDGEGATKLVDIRVSGAATEADAYKAALAVAKSPLCKTALFGEDANWGRIINAVGYSGAQFDPEAVDILIGDVAVCRQGQGTGFSEAEAAAALKKDEVTITIDLNQGTRSDHFWTCDFSYDYVKINGSYRS
jgi:glutamate N-acetyltransferase/amino-acid N-acetyltransferase